MIPEYLMYRLCIPQAAVCHLYAKSNFGLFERTFLVYDISVRRPDRRHRNG